MRGSRMTQFASWARINEGASKRNRTCRVGSLGILWRDKHWSGRRNQRGTSAIVLGAAAIRLVESQACSSPALAMPRWRLRFHS
jgi:hypothetical protein